jgi:hypothetical protein
MCPSLLAPETLEIRAVGSPRYGAAQLVESLTSTLQEPGTAVVIDLEPGLGVHIAAHLNQLRLANAVLVLPRWPYAEAILPVDGLLHSLVSLSTRLIAEDLPNVAFVLDAERNRAVPQRPANDERADNRSRLSVADLPNLAALRARGIRRVVTISPTAARVTRRYDHIVRSRMNFDDDVPVNTMSMTNVSALDVSTAKAPLA